MPPTIGAAAAIATQLAVPEILARLLSQRGVGLDEAARFLAPRLRDQLPDPAHLQDMDRAVERLVRAIREREKIVVFGDYDVDGATSAALLLRFFAAVGAEGGLYVPDRMREGYGPNAPALLRLKDEGVGLVICVDCGTTAHEALEAAKDAGLDLIVIDHHVAEPLLPSAVAVVNPNRLDEASAHGNLAAVGVAFLLAVAANRALRDSGWYRARPEPDLLQWLDLVALGTVCDVVPLTGLNRALVAQGLKVASRGANLGMAALAALGAAPGRIEPINAYQLGFVLGPRVNAGGRVGAADLGARLLSTDDPALAAELAQRLDGYNKERREIERATLEAAIELVERQNAESPVLVFAAAEGWHPGVIGIVAARLRERYDRPACVVALADGIGRGSGRSIPGLALGSAVIAARQAGLLINGGGHAMAAGFTVAADKLVELQDFLAARLNDGLDHAKLVPELAIDAAITPGAAQRWSGRPARRACPVRLGQPRAAFCVSGRARCLCRAGRHRASAAARCRRARERPELERHRLSRRRHARGQTLDRGEGQGHPHCRSPPARYLARRRRGAAGCRRRCVGGWLKRRTVMVDQTDIPEGVHEHHHHTEEGGDAGFRRWAAIYLGVVAMLLAISSLGGGKATKEMLAYNIRVSDTYAFAQAKYFRETAYDLAADQLEAEIAAQPAIPDAAKTMMTGRSINTASRRRATPATRRPMRGARSCSPRPRNWKPIATTPRRRTPTSSSPPRCSRSRSCSDRSRSSRPRAR